MTGKTRSQIGSQSSGQRGKEMWKKSRTFRSQQFNVTYPHADNSPEPHGGRQRLEINRLKHDRSTEEGTCFHRILKNHFSPRTPSGKVLVQHHFIPTFQVSVFTSEGQKPTSQPKQISQAADSFFMPPLFGYHILFSENCLFGFQIQVQCPTKLP